MKKFKFKLEKVLLQREINLELAQKDFSEIMKIKNDEEEILSKMINSKEEAKSQSVKLIETTKDWVLQVDQINRYLAGQDLRIKNQNERLMKIEKLVESRREILQQKATEVKILERLKEKQQREYVEEVNKKEQAEIDEMAVIRFARNDSLLKD